MKESKITYQIFKLISQDYVLDHKGMRELYGRWTMFYLLTRYRYDSFLGKIKKYLNHMFHVCFRRHHSG